MLLIVIFQVSSQLVVIHVLVTKLAAQLRTANLLKASSARDLEHSQPRLQVVHVELTGSG